MTHATFGKALWSRPWMRAAGAAGVTALAATMVACGSGSGPASGDTVTVAGDVPIAYALRANTVGLNPTDGAPFAAGGDLMIREKSSPSAREINVTASITQGRGDVSDPEVSYDGKKIVFALNCPATNTSQIAGAAACTGRWNIWEYDMTTGGLAGGSLRRITSSATDDDVDPAYLPGGRGYVFSSNRQTQSKTVINGQSFFAVDEYERERVLNLHTMAPDGTAVTQISVNQSHDRNPVVKANGDLMFSRWEHVGPRNRFAIFKAKPDGTDMFVLYGAHSPGNSFLHPREMDPAGPYKGQVASSLMSLSGTREGGQLVLIDIANFSENSMPATAQILAAGGQGQRQLTDRSLNGGRGLSLAGRATSPYPLWDGTDRVLVSYRPCVVTKDNVVVSCTTLTPAEIDRLGSDRTMEEEAADSIQDNVPPSYGVYMYDPKPQTWLPVALPPAGFMNVDPVAIQARAEPSAATPTSIDASLAAQGKALIEVRSVYDTDGLGRMAEGVLAPVDLPAGCSRGIAMTAPTDTNDTRSSVADLARMKDPANAAYNCQPARFVRATRAMAPMAGMTGMRDAIGETEFEPQQILGYAPVEPDGSFKLLVPADTPLALAILDAKGRALQTHLNWIQVRPGERRTCDGCHSPRRGASINAGATVNTMPSSLIASLASQHQSGETMAALRTRLDANALNLGSDPLFTDVWADTTKPGVTARSAIALRYTGNANPADDLATAAPINGTINYPDHIQPIWARDRGANTCTTCHADTARLDLRATISGAGRLTSYQELVLGDPLIGPNGQPVTRIEDGVAMIVRGPALVETMAGGAEGLARSSRLTEILFGELLKAGADARTAHPNPPGTAPDHSRMLNAAEKRLVTEWMDLGGQYFNNVNASNSPARRAAALSETVFRQNVMPVLQGSCIGCHQPTGSSGAGSAASFARNRFILTGSAEGDFNVTLSMVSNTCNAAANALLARPSTVPHPSGALTQTAAVLPVGSAGYTAIANWITAGCVQ
jgi:Hydrazine synthase alpha subunit middle domain